MFNPLIKKALSVSLAFGILIATYSLFSKETNTSPENLLLHANTKHLEQEKVIQQRLSEEFEKAFIKQYTPPINCENFEYEISSVECDNHLIKAKQAFRQEFIKLRGLPKDTFEHQQFSFAD